MVKSPPAVINPIMIKWAHEQSDVPETTLDKKAPKWKSWMMGESSPSFHELELFSEVIRIPLGYFFLDRPPADDGYRPQFRTFGNQPVDKMSTNLRDTLLINQARQQWYKDFATRVGLDEVTFVGSIDPSDDIEPTARKIEAHLDMGVGMRNGTSSEFLSRLINDIEEMGILVVKTGFAGTNTRRTLDPQEFRGFALSDGIAPLIFVNGADTHYAQIFSLIHEFLHLGIGQTGLTTDDSISRMEQWANKVVGEVLAPAAFLLKHFDSTADIATELSRLGTLLKCSPLVVGRVARDFSLISSTEFQDFEDEYVRLFLERRDQETSAGGGNYYLSKPYQTSRRFAEAVIKDTWTRGTTFTEALGLLQIRSLDTFDQFAAKLGIG